VPGRASWSTIAESDLAAFALAGTTEAWDELVRRHSRSVWLTLLAHGVRADTAEDLVQEVWMRLIQQQRAGRLPVLQLPGLAIAQARWVAYETQRTSHRREMLAASSLPWERGAGSEAIREANCEDRVLARDRLEEVARVLETCSPRAQRVFLAVYGAHWRSQEEVARAEGLSLQRVRQILSELRGKMKEAIAAREGRDWNT